MYKEPRFGSPNQLIEIFITNCPRCNYQRAQHRFASKVSMFLARYYDAILGRIV